MKTRTPLPSGVSILGKERACGVESLHERPCGMAPVVKLRKPCDRVCANCESSEVLQSVELSYFFGEFDLIAVASVRCVRCEGFARARGQRRRATAVSRNPKSIDSEQRFAANDGVELSRPGTSPISAPPFGRCKSTQRDALRREGSAQTDDRYSTAGCSIVQSGGGSLTPRDLASSILRATKLAQ